MKSLRLMEQVLTKEGILNSRIKNEMKYDPEMVIDLDVSSDSDES